MGGKRISMMYKLFLVLMTLSALVISGCEKNHANEELPTPTPTPTPTPVVQAPLFDFPSGTILMSDLFPESISKIELECSDMSGKYMVSIEEKDNVSEFLNNIGELELTDDFEPIFGAGGQSVKLSIYSDEQSVITIEESSAYGTMDVEYDGLKKSYALVDEVLREETVFLPILDEALEGYRLLLNNGKYDIEFIPLLVEGDGYLMKGEVGTYSWPVFNFETIDFSGYKLLIDDEEIESLPKEPGEYVLVVETDQGLYQLKISVD